MSPGLRGASDLSAIRKYGAGCLRRIADPVDPGSVAARDLLDELWAVLSADGGVGLAAPQIGIRKRAVVIRDPARSQGNQRLDLVNPVIEKTSGPDKPFEEGCLSFPGLYTTVRRPQGVEVSYHDYEGNLCNLTDRGLVARIVQHEVDHLDGVLFIDHLSSWNRFLLGPRLLLIMIARLMGK